MSQTNMHDLQRCERTNINQWVEGLATLGGEILRNTKGRGKVSRKLKQHKTTP